MCLHGNRPRDGNALLLSAREQMRCCLRIRFHPHERKCILHTRADLLWRNAEVFGTERHIIRHNSRNKLIVRILEHHADLLADVPPSLFILRIPTAHKARSLCRKEKRIQMTCEC